MGDCRADFTAALENGEERNNAQMGPLSRAGMGRRRSGAEKASGSGVVRSSRKRLARISRVFLRSSEPRAETREDAAR